MTWSVRRAWLALGVAIVVETWLAVACQGDYIASDPLWYASLAHDIAAHTGQALGTHPFEMRVGLTLPLALMYKLFGVSPVVTSLPCILAALGTLVVVWWAAPTPRGKVLACVFVLTCTALTRHTGFLNVDLPCAALMGASVLCLARRRLVAAMALWFAAFLTKETGLWLAPVWLYAIVRDARALGLRQTARAFAPALAVGAVLGIAYLVVCAHVWGSPWARFAGIQELTGQHAWSIDDQPSAVWIDRLVWDPPALIAKLFRAALIPILLAPWLVRGADRIWGVATLTIVLLYWFGSTSMSAYSPLPILPRMIMPAVPCGLVLATLATEAGLARLDGTRWKLPVVIGLVAALAIPCAGALHTTIVRPRPETAAYAVIRDAASRPGHLTLVCGDPRCAAASAIYFGFEPPPNLTIEDAASFAQRPVPAGDRVLAIIDRRRLVAGEPDRLVTAGLPAIVADPEVRLYDAADGRRLWTALH